jgi:hypothetical protein
MSKNGVAVVLFIGSLFGVEMTESGVVEVVGAITTLVSFGLLVINQARRPDVKWFLWKTPERD